MQDVQNFVGKNMGIVEYKSLGEITAERLRDAIITCEFAPGVRITETEVSESMGVSRIVVREAMQILLHEGLLIKERNKFTKVVDFSHREIEEIFDLRIAIEQAAAKRCSNEPHFIENLINRANSIQEIVKTSQYKRLELLRADMDFHNYIVRCSQNLRFIKVWQEITGPIFVLLYRYINADHDLHYSHEEIIQAFNSANEVQIRNEIQSHVEDTKQLLLSTL